MSAYRIVLADDHVMFRSALCATIQADDFVPGFLPFKDLEAT